MVVGLAYLWRNIGMAGLDGCCHGDSKTEKKVQNKVRRKMISR